MKTCIECGDVKFGFQFVSTNDGIATYEHAVCKKCTKQLGINAAIDRTCSYNREKSNN